jgi:hypothetical protein
VVARINPLRWIKGDLPEAEKVLQTMRDRAARFNTEKGEAAGSLRRVWRPSGRRMSRGRAPHL